MVPSYYWVKYAKDPMPTRIQVRDWQHFVNTYLDIRYLLERGEIEWMIRD